MMTPKKVLFILLISISCKSVIKDNAHSISKIKIDTLLVDNISIRAISVNKNTIYYAADKNRIGTIQLKSGRKVALKIKKDSLKIEFRSGAKTKNSFFALSISNPALLYQFSNNLLTKKLVYTEQHENVFYDSMQFYDHLNGIAVGDPINGYMSIIRTTNGGKNWLKNSPENSPKLDIGEAFFAASNTNITIKNGKTWVVSGGKKSRIFLSNDKGATWKTIETPIIQGETMTGIFTSDFYDDKIGIIAGGNYEKPDQNFQNKAITFDGGISWKLIAENEGFGYASCVQFVPDSAGKKIVSVGLTGIYLSNNFGTSWFKLSDDKSLYTLRFIDQNTAIAAGKGKIIKIHFLEINSCKH